ncbi:MAG TPA: MopE-related protein [Chitinophagales bacterium]|nr:MopE-related protein [Chitinophagales bacterium]
MKTQTPLRLTMSAFIVWQFMIISISFAQVAPIKQWDARFGGSSDDNLHSIQQTPDGGYIMAGHSLSGLSGDKTQASRGSWDYWAVKTDSNGSKQWDNRFGGSGADELFTIKQTPDGGYILAGTSASGISGDKTQATHGSWDYWVVKIDANGSKQWDKDYGGTGDDFLKHLQLTSDGGYILGGYSTSGISGDKTQGNQGNKDYWIVKIDADGAKQWDKTFGGTSEDYETVVQQTSDGGYILGGYSSSGISGDKTQASQGGIDYWIVKTDANGNKQWDKRFGGSSDDLLWGLQQTSDGDYILAGYSSSGISGDKTQASQGGTDYWVVKVDADGIKLLDFRFGGSGDDSNNETNEAAQQTPDGGFIFGGYSASGISGDKSQASQGNWDYWIVRTDATGIKLWDARFGGSGLDEFTDLQLTSEGGYILAGVSQSGISGDKTQTNRGANDYWIVKLAPDCTPQTFYADADGDGYGNPNITTTACSQPTGYVTNNTDCDDTNMNVYSGASDICNGIDDNCNGVIDENAITATISPEGTVTVCKGTKVTLTANGGSGISYQWKKGNTTVGIDSSITYTTKNAGNYKVIESNSFGCTSASAVTIISTIALPSATITSQGNLDICGTGSVVLQANSGSGLTYQWKKGSGEIPGETNQTYTATTKGTYKVVVTNSNGCSKTSAGVKVTKSCKEASVEINKIPSSTLALSPNPSPGNFIIDLKFNEEVNDNGSIEVMNLVGQIVYSEKLAVTDGELKKEISLDHSLPGGMYLVKVMMNSKVYSSQLIYQK